MTRRHRLALLCLGVAAAALLAWASPPRAAAQPVYDIDHCGNTSDRLLLTFDDWSYNDPYVATRVGEFMRERGVRAAFFLINIQARNYPDIVQTLRSQGHYVLNHTYSHPHLLQLLDSDVIAEISNGIASNLLRPPYGEFDSRIEGLAAGLGYRICKWTTGMPEWYSDGSWIPTETIRESVRNIPVSVKRGGVLLGHLHSNYPNAIDEIISDTRAHGVELCANDGPVGAMAPFPLDCGSTVPPPTSNPIVSDEFERSVASGFGTADVGGPWSVSSTARTKVAGGEGVIYGWSGGNQDVQASTSGTAGDIEILGLLRLNAANPTGGSYQARLVARAQTDARNGYVARITHTTAGAANWALLRVDNGGGTGTLTLAQGTLASSGAAGSSWWIRLRASGTTVQARFWRAGTSEPSTWTATAADSYWASGRAGLGAYLGATITSPFPQIGFDHFFATALGP